MSEGERGKERGKQAELRAQRIRWRGRFRSMNQASRAREMNEQASNLDKQLSRQAEESKGWHARWDDPPRLE